MQHASEAPFETSGMVGQQYVDVCATVGAAAGASISGLKGRQEQSAGSNTACAAPPLMKIRSDEALSTSNKTMKQPKRTRTTVSAYIQQIPEHTWQMKPMFGFATPLRALTSLKTSS